MWTGLPHTQYTQDNTGKYEVFQNITITRNILFFLIKNLKDSFRIFCKPQSRFF